MIKVVIADDHEIVREGLAQLLGKERLMQVVGQAKDGREAIALVDRLKPDVVVMDAGMPLLNGVEATRHIVKKHSNARVLILSMYTDENTVTQAVKSGVSGFLLKNGTSRELVEAIHAVAGGKTYFPAGIIARLRCDGKKTNLETLTHKEKQVLQLIAEGYTTKEIARHMALSFHTVKTHRNHIMSKLNLHSVAALTRVALANRLTVEERR